MIWEDKRLSEVGEADLRKILNSGVEEHKHLDYKAELYSNNDAGQKDFLVDVCAFANGEGGVLLIGVPELRDPVGGQPTGAPDPANLQGIESKNPEATLVSYDSRVVSRIEERLSLETHAIKLANGRYVFAIRVPNSQNKPHCVRWDDKRYFPSRRDRHNYYMDVQEIKEVVMRTASRQQQAEELLLEACKEVRGATDLPYLVIATIPMFWENFLVDFRDEKILKEMRTFTLVDTQVYGNCGFSFQGIERRGERYEAVAQLRRNGLLRYSQQLPVQQQSGVAAFSPTAIEIQLRKFVRKAANLYSIGEIGGPFLLCVVLTSKSPASGLYPDSIIPQAAVIRGRLHAGVHAFPIMMASDFTEFDLLLRPLCDQVHQTFGEEASPNYNRDGKWSVRDT
jgi:Putative DNA-binding domain